MNEVWNTEMSQTQDTNVLFRCSNFVNCLNRKMISAIFTDFVQNKYIPKTSEACDPSFSLSSNLPL